MRCIFCKIDASQSRSVEHIIPESLGNTTHILPVGVVCDRCNNYFARKVEKPFLTSAPISLLRFHQELVTKNGRVPKAVGEMVPGGAVTLRRDPKSGCKMHVEVPADAFDAMNNSDRHLLIMQTELAPPEGEVASRFVAKVAVESMARRLLHNFALLEAFIDDVQMDLLRNHARRGARSSWPIHTRRIYDTHARWTIGGNERMQVIHESDFLFTEHREVFFVLALFGHEYVINVLEPDICGYLDWLEVNDSASPLHHGKNARGPFQPSKEVA
jgi:hypothetical protein